MTARVRGVALILSGSVGVWLLLALTVLPSLHLARVTLGAAGAIIAVQAGALLYALQVAAHARPRTMAHVTYTSGVQPPVSATPTIVFDHGSHRRGLDHLGWLAQLCQILGLLGTVAGFILEMRALAGVTGSASMTPLIGQMSRGLATAMVATFCGVLASVSISLAQHTLEG